MTPKKYPLMPCVTSELSRKEMLTNPDALASMKKEWSKLIDQGVFDLDAVYGNTTP